MNTSISSIIQNITPEYDQLSRNNALQELYADYDKQRDFYFKRVEETQDVIDMFKDRIEAEATYAMRLVRIFESGHKGFKIGKIAEEVRSFKASCQARAQQADEVSNNVFDDCVIPLQQLLEKQDLEYRRINSQAQELIDQVHRIDKDIKTTAINYFKSANAAEEALIKYQSVKFAADMSFQGRNMIYQQMTQSLVKMRENETKYKETVDESNNFLVGFRQKMVSLSNKLKELEGPRCEAIHSTINQFVVFETSAEMNNKYDVGNFAKLLEEFKVDEEVKELDTFLYGDSTDEEASQKCLIPRVVKNPKFEFVSFENSSRGSKIDIHKVTAAQLKEPPQNIAEFVKSDSLNQEEKIELVEFIIQNIFNVQPLHTGFKEILAGSGVEMRTMIIKAIEQLFPGREFFQPVIFNNIVQTFYQFLDQIMNEDLSQIEPIRLVASRYFRQFDQRSNQPPLNVELSLMRHPVWQKPEAWMLREAQIPRTQQGLENLLSYMVKCQTPVETMKLVSEQLLGKDQEDLMEFCRGFMEAYTRAQLSKQKQAELAQEKKKLNFRTASSFISSAGSATSRFSSFVGSLVAEVSASENFPFDNPKSRQGTQSRPSLSDLLEGTQKPVSIKHRPPPTDESEIGIAPERTNTATKMMLKPSLSQIPNNQNL